MKFLTVLVLVASLCSISFAQTSAKPEAGALCAEFERTFQKADASAIEKLFTKDASLLSLGGQIFQGGSAIAQGMAAQAGLFDIHLKPTLHRLSGDMLYEAGMWAHTAKGSDTTLTSGTFVSIWKEVKGEWKIELLSVTPAQKAK